MGNVITAFTEPSITEAPDGSDSQEQFFYTMTITGDVMTYERIFVLTRDPNGNSSTANLPFSAVLTRID